MNLNQEVANTWVAAIMVLIVAVANWMQSREAKKEAEKAKQQAAAAGASAESAVALSTPTGNGFARRVEESLAAILAQQEETNRRIAAVEATSIRTEGKIDRHIEAHAESDVHNRRRS